METHKIVKPILISIASITIIIVILASILQKNKKQAIEESSIGVGEREVEKYDNGFEGISDFGMYNAVQGAISNFLSAQNIEVIAHETNETNPNTYRASTQEEKNQIIYDMLDAKYVENNDITVDNLTQKLSQENYMGIIPFETRAKYNNKVDMYLAHVGLIQEDSVKQKMYLIRIDKQNKTYSVEPLSDENMKINTIQVNENNEEIRQNTYNQYTISDTISTQMVAQKYFNHLKMILKYCPQIAYNNYFEDEYKQKRFGNEENIVRYSNINKDEISKLQLEKYRTESEGDKTKYIIQDQYENTYEFIENNIMEYTVKLDDYTIPAEEVIEQYKSKSERDKISLNVDRVIKMINSRDFYGLYNVLDETYKATKFPTLEEFEQYIKDKFSKHYNWTIANSLAEKSTYILDLNLQSMEENVHEAFRIIMQLGDDLDFKISFNK